jgi:hypothetical protein
VKKADTEIMRTDRISQDRGLLRRIEEREDEVFSLSGARLCNK